MRHCIGVWDFARQSGMYGDFITFLMMVACTAEDAGISRRRVLLIDDPRRPNAGKPKSPECRADFAKLAELLTEDIETRTDTEAAYTELEAYRGDGHEIYPSDLSGTAYGWLRHPPRLFHRCCVPRLRMPPRWTDAAKSSHIVQVSDWGYCALNLRHQDRQHERNTDRDAWREALEHIRRKPGVCRQIIQFGTEEELQYFDLPGVRKMPVHGADIRLDCALVQNSRFSVFNSGGMVFVAQATHAPLVYWHDHTSGANRHNRLSPADGLTPKYLRPDQVHYPWQHPGPEEIIDAIESRFPW